MQMELLWCLLGLVAGLFINGKEKKPVESSMREIVKGENIAKKIMRLDVLLNNIEIYDGTDKNQIQLTSEED